MKRHVKNQRGDAFLLSIVLMAVAVIVFLAIQTLGQNLEAKFSQMRIRTRMSLIESQIRQHFRQPSSFTGCQSGQSDLSSCQINTSAFEKIASIPGVGSLCAFAGNAPCVFRSQIENFNTTTRQVRVRLEFLGAENMSPSTFTIEVPDEILQSASFSCPELDPTKPIMSGIDPQTGRVVCRALTNCPTGQHMTGVDPNTGQPICTALPTQTITCPSNSFLSHYEWKGSTVTHTCSPRLDPFQYFRSGP